MDGHWMVVKLKLTTGKWFLSPRWGSICPQPSDYWHSYGELRCKFDICAACVEAMSNKHPWTSPSSHLLNISHIKRHFFMISSCKFPQFFWPFWLFTKVCVFENLFGVLYTICYKLNILYFTFFHIWHLGLIFVASCFFFIQEYEMKCKLCGFAQDRISIMPVDPEKCRGEFWCGKLDKSPAQMFSILAQIFCKGYSVS